MLGAEPLLALLPLDVADVVRAHAPYVVRTLRHLGVNARDLDDAAQEVFLVVHRKRERWDAAQGSLRNWIYGICVHHVMHYRRAHARRPEVPTMNVAENEMAEGSVEVNRDARWLALWVLQQLDDEKRAVFVLFEIEGLSMNEVVTIVQCPLKTGYSRLHAARAIVQTAHATAKERGWL